jgi:hypothetical protein
MRGGAINRHKLRRHPKPRGPGRGAFSYTPLQIRELDAEPPGPELEAGG